MAQAQEDLRQQYVSEATLLYVENCAICHGASGEGIGATVPLDNAGLRESDYDDIFKTIARGRYDTAMAGWHEDEGGVFNDYQIEELVAMIRYVDWSQVREVAAERDMIPPTLPVPTVDDEFLAQVAELGPDGEILAHGIQLYAEQCTICHGVNGEGSDLAPALNTEEIRATDEQELAASVLLPMRQASHERSQSVWRYLAVPLAMLLIVASGYSLRHYYANPVYSKSRGWRELATKLEQLSKCLPPDQVRLIQNYPDPTLWYYYTGPVEHLVLPPIADDAVLSASEVDNMVEAGVQWAYFVEQPSSSWDADGVAVSALQQAYDGLAVDYSTNWPIHVFSRASEEWTPADILFGNGVEVRGIIVEAGEELAMAGRKGLNNQ